MMDDPNQVISIRVETGTLLCRAGPHLSVIAADLIDLIISSMHKLNRIGLKGHPYLTPANTGIS